MFLDKLRMRWLLMVGLALPSLAAGQNTYNVSYAELHKCKQYNAVSGYNYREYFKLRDLDHHNVDNGTIVDLRLYVMATRDAHIMLSETQDKLGAYEIVIGGGANTFSQIRAQAKGPALKTAPTLNILSPIDPLPVRLLVTTSGNISLFKNNSDDPFMSTVVANMKPIHYVSFTTWSTALGKWFYDCPFGPPSSSLDLILDGKTRLMNNFTARGTLTSPSGFAGIDIAHLYVEGFAFEHATGMVGLFGYMQMRWTDERYSWTPEDYDNVTEVHSCSAIWIPELFSDRFSGMSGSCVVQYDGLVVVDIAEFKWTNFCSQNDAYRWPYDENECILTLSVASYDEKIAIRMSTNATSFYSDYEQSDWSITHVAKQQLQSSTTMYGNGPTLMLLLKMKRNSEIHSSSMYPTYFVSNFLLFLSFLSKGRTRIMLNYLGFIILLHCFLCMSTIAPTNGTPKLSFVWFYFVSNVLFVIDCWLDKYPRKLSPSSVLAQFLNYPYLRIILRLDERSNYSSLQQKEIEWKDLVNVLNRLIAVAVLITFAIGFERP